MTSLRNRRLVVATRGSQLALRQTEIVADLIRGAHPDITIEVSPVTTRGDKDQRAFSAIGGKGLFTSEVEREVVEGRADIAVHSAKDLTTDLVEGCIILCIPERGPVEDVVVGGEGGTGDERIASLPAGAKVGTSSIRRRSLLAELRPDLDAVDFRGNLDTRLRKVAEGRVDAAIVAAAGVDRLQAAADFGGLDTARWIPPPGQGALAVEARIDSEDLAELFVGLGDPNATAEVLCERGFARRLEGGCSVPLGCLARASEGTLVAHGYIGTPDGSASVRDKTSGSLSEAAELGTELGDAVLQAGGADILEALEDEQVTTPSPP